MATKKKHDIAEVLSQVHAYGINLNTREIYLHSYPGVGDEEPGIEYRSATNFIKNLHLLDAISQENILVHMHIVGGAYADGMAIYDAIKFARSPVTILAHAQASSMSGIIFQAAKKRIMMSHCEYLIHFGSISVDSDSIAAKSVIDWNDLLHKEMLHIFAERAIQGEFFRHHKMSLEKTTEYLDHRIRQVGDWFIDAKQAVCFGLTDGILGIGNYKTIDKIRN